MIRAPDMSDSPDTSRTPSPARDRRRPFVIVTGLSGAGRITALSVISTPRALISDPSGPMQNGMTYIVRPRMLPRKRGVRVARISSGASGSVFG